MSDGKKIASKAKKSDIFAAPDYPDPSKKSAPKKSGDSPGSEAAAETKKIAQRGKNSGIFDVGTKFEDTHNNAVEGASPKKFVTKKGRSEAEDALYSANQEAVANAKAIREQSKNKANACSADSALYDKEHEKMTFETEAMRNLEVSAGSSKVTGSEAKAGRKAIGDKSKGSTVFQIGEETVEHRGLKTTIKNEIAKPPRGELNSENAKVSEEVKKEREAQRARGKASEVFGFGGGDWAEASKGADQKVTDRPMGAGNYKPAEQAANQAANKAKRQALLAGNGPLW